MKKLILAAPLCALACAGAPASDGTLRTVLLIGAGVLAVVLLILFGRPKKTSAPESEQKTERK